MRNAPESLDSFFGPGRGECFKALVHIGAIAIGTALCLYSIGAWLDRGDRRLACNSLLYGLFVGYEGWQVARHLRQPDKERAG